MKEIIFGIIEHSHIHTHIYNKETKPNQINQDGLNEQANKNGQRINTGIG